MFIPKMNAEDPTVSGSGAGGGVTATKTIDDNLKNEIQKIVMGIVNSVIPRTVEQSIKQSIPTLLDKIAEEALKDDPAAPSNVAPSAEDKTTLKSLRTQVESLQRELKQQSEQTKQAQQRAKDSGMRADFKTALQKKLGADNPLVDTVMDSLYDVKKRIVEGPNGKIAVKFTDEWGNEELKPLEDGVNSLFEGEYKHLVQQSKAPQMPVGGFNMRPQGQPFRPGQQQQGQPRINPLLAEVASSLMETRPEGAHIIMEDAAKLAAQVPRK